MSMYRLNFKLMHIFKYSLADIENMIPFERELYVDLIRKHQEKLKEDARQKQQRQQ